MQGCGVHVCRVSRCRVLGFGFGSGVQAVVGSLGPAVPRAQDFEGRGGVSAIVSWSSGSGSTDLPCSVGPACALSARSQVWDDNGLRIVMPTTLLEFDRIGEMLTLQCAHGRKCSIPHLQYPGSPDISTKERRWPRRQHPNCVAGPAAAAPCR